MKRLNKTYVDMFIIATLFLIIVAFAITFILTLGDLNSPIIIDIDQDLSGVFSNKVIVDDKNRDYFYYKGLNYTWKTDGVIPSGADQNIYPDSKLVEAKVTYASTDINTTFKGYVSLSETQDIYEYLKIYDVKDNGTPTVYTDDYILIELIENPYTNRPNNKGFNGWYTSYPGVKLIYDNVYYIRYAKVPITYDLGYPQYIEVNFNASWVNATVANLSGSNWATAFTALKTKQMTNIPTNNQGVPIVYLNDFNANYNMAGFYRQILIAQGSSMVGYYDLNGDATIGNCATVGGCTLYELINYYNNLGQLEILDPALNYYYLVTRDTNIIVMNVNTNTTWVGTKPFTLTSIHNGNDYRSNIFNTNGTSVQIYNDTTIENIRIQSGATPNNQQTGPSGNMGTSRVLYGNYKNLRVGRGLISTENIQNFTAIVGGNNSASGSSSNITKYRLIVESGFYQDLSAINGAANRKLDVYINNKTIFGNDYDRVTNNNDNLVVYYCLAGSWGTYLYGENTYSTMYDITIKSGGYGVGKFDYLAGVYAGGRTYGLHYSARKLKVEGGWIYNLIGGPSVDSVMTDINNTFIYMVGGSVDVIFGGAERPKTYGNRIIQVTGGTVNYSVFGGSNGYLGNSSDGMLAGDSFVYIGGNATIGSEYNVTNNITIYGAEAGSVFGVGNGRSRTSVIGSCSASNVMTNDYAVINRNVFGGGNFAAIGVSSGKTTTSANMFINGGTIKGSVFGGGNLNDAGNATVKATININTTGGQVEGSLYGGSNLNGTVYGDVNLNILGGTFLDSIYGGGKGGYVDATSPGTYVRDKINIIVGTIDSVPVVTNNIYGGSALGTVNDLDETPGLSTNGIDIVINNIQSTGSVFGGAKGSSTFSPKVNGNINITVNGGTLPNLFGGNDTSGVVMGNSTIVLNGGTIGYTYGGGNQVQGNVSNITLSGAAAGDIFGGSNQSGNIISSTITITSGTANNIYGGNNIGGNTPISSISVQGGTTGNIYGGGKLTDTNTTNIQLVGGNVGSVYGGGESASINTSATINLTGSAVGNIFGGSNQSGNVPISTITLNGGSATNVYGGNNVGGTVLDPIIVANAGTITNIYAGGKLADTPIGNVTVNGGTITSVYGGGEQASIATTTTLLINDGQIGNIYGGSNVSGTVPTSSIHVLDGTIGNIYGGNNMGGVTNNPSIVIDGGTITAIFGGGNQANTPFSDILINNNSSTQIGTIYGGGNFASVPTTNILVHGGTVNTIYGGSNQSGQVTTSNIDIDGTSIIGDIYGGNNLGGTTIDSYITTTTGVTVSNIYGGGNQAQQSGNTNLIIYDTTITNEIYGGGKDGVVLGNTEVRLTDSSVGSSVYAGGKGVTAVVRGNTLLNVEGANDIVNHVFGGGNAGATGTALTNNSSSVVNITGGDIGGNVYGGANTSVIYGTVDLNIGCGLTDPGLICDDINIGGTVFGGGEANASGNPEFDFSFISVTTGIDIYIKDDLTNIVTIDGSIFGSGNASSTTGYSYVTIEDYGTVTNHKRNISIQRADLVTIDNSVIELYGATDRTNEYSSVLFTISRVEELKLKNNSTLYLETGTNLLQKFSSLVDIASVETLAEVTIDAGVITKNVDNRIYALDGKNVNIATNQAVTDYGEVDGMTFFGMYIRDFAGNVEEAFYSRDYNEGDTVLPGEFYAFSSGSYVLGSHELNHDIEVDGFYSNYENELIEGVIEVKYIIPTPESSNYYMWTIGEAISSYEVDLIASKFSTLGAYELSLINTPEPNVLYSIVGVNYSNLPSNFELVDKYSIPRISPDGTADTKMSLTMKSSNTGWITVGETTYLTDPMNPIDGDEVYLKENSPVVPTLLFNLYHSKNLQTSGSAGSVTISLIAIVPIDDLTNDVVRINIIVNITRELFSTNEYEGAMTKGEEHDYFVSTAANITNKSKLTAYFGLYVESPTTIYQTGYHRSLVSSYVIPENTKFTMIDLTTATPTYYYYKVSAADVVAATQEFSLHNEASYNLSKFINMGSTTTTNNYDDALQNALYYDPINQYANEEFIFIVDFADTGLSTDILNKTLLIELRDAADQTMIGVLGINYTNLTYSLYNDKDSVIDVSATISDSNIYIGESTTLNITSNFTQQIVGGRTINDTTFYNKKMGIKITIYDSNDNILNASSLLGVTFTHNSITYYPRMDGIVRINVSPRIANVYSQITINTVNSTLQSGTYRIKMDSFGSFDGIYYGLVPSDTAEVYLSILNNIFGLSSTLSQNSTIVDSLTGQGTNGSNMFVFNLKYSSGVSNPKIIISLKRRKYDTIYSLDYQTVDILNYVTNSYYPFGLPANKQYVLTETPQANQDIYVFTEPNLVTGTYKVIFSLYDGTSYIGEVYNYLVIR